MEPEDYQLIDQHFSGKLDEARRQRLQQKLAQDAEFAAAFQLRTEMEDFLEKRPKREKLKAKLQALGATSGSLEKEEETRIIPLAQQRRRLFWVAGVAAAIALIILALWPFLFPTSLYEQFNEHRPLALQERGTSSTAQAETAFNQQDYATAYDLLDEYLQTQPDDLRAQLALGICALEMDRFAEAQSIFETIRQGQSALVNSATWYMALTYLKQEQITEVRNYLEQIPDGTFWYKKAQELLGKLH